MLTCKQFLQELTDYLDEALEPGARAQLERHVNDCPNCWVVCNTTKRTLQVFKGMEAKDVPAEIQGRLLQALERRIADKGPLCGSEQSNDTAGSGKQSSTGGSANDPATAHPRPVV